MIETAGALLLLATLPATIELLLTTLGVLFYKAKPLSHLDQPPPKTALLIPSHNEAHHIRQTLRSVQKCTGEYDLIVIADNCTDQTAAFAKEENAQVLERRSPLKGKHYAINEAIAHFKNYDLYIIIDADTEVEPNLVETFQRYIQQGWKAVQGLYLLPAEGPYFSSRLASIAFTGHNALRPMGRSAFGLSCGIFGNGVALSRELIQTIPFPKDTIVEDAAYHIELVKRGIKVGFAPETKLTAVHPETSQDSARQQQRWQGGRLRLWLNEASSLLKCIFQGKWACIEPFLDLSTPPLAYYTIALLILLATPFKGYALIGLLVLGIHLLQTLIFRKQGFADLLALTFTPYYLVKRLLSVGHIWKGSRKGQAWTRTKRKGE